MRVVADIEILEALRRCGGAAQPTEIAWWTGYHSHEARQALAMLGVSGYLDEVGENYLLTADGHEYLDSLVDERDTPGTEAVLQPA